MSLLDLLFPAIDKNPCITRRRILQAIGATAAGAALELPLLSLPSSSTPSYPLARQEEEFLDDMQRRGCMFFWEQGSPSSGQVLDRARSNGSEQRRMASIASTGFGLTALCIADARGYIPHKDIVERVRATLRFHWEKLPQVHGFFYHFSDIETGVTAKGSELSSIDTSLLLCGVLTCRAHFNDAEIQDLATKIYERVEWPWMLNGGATFSMGWFPEKGFIPARWDTYSEEMMLYLLAIGSPTHPVGPEYWSHFSRPHVEYYGLKYISNDAPIFIHQYSHAWYDFRGKRDAYANYFTNSITATRAHKMFCLSLKKFDYDDNYWGITASDWKGGYTAWGGPPAMGPIDGSVVPAAAAGSLAFVPEDCLHVLMAMKRNYGNNAWGKYGFVDAFNRRVGWYDTDVLGIDLGIGVLMAENLRSGFVWDTFMKNSEAAAAMQKCGFKGA